MAEIGVEEEKEMLRKKLKRSIYRVPGWLKDHVCDGNDKTPYEPEIISFGPYHRGNSRVTEMEKHKRRCLRTMLGRKHQHFNEYTEEMKKLEQNVRDCYQEQFDEIDSEAFVEMLVLDGCFMLEFLRVTKLGFTNLNYDYDDPVFSKHTVILVIARDMIKLENQLPLIVLEKLLSLQYKQPIRNKKHVPKLVLRALTPIWISNQILSPEQLKPMRNAVAANPDNMMLHCLDIFRSSLLYKTPEDRVNVEIGEAVEIRDNATQVQIQTHANDGPDMVQPSPEHVSIDSPAVISFKTAFASSSSNTRLYPPDQSSSDEEWEENKNMRRSCLSNLKTRVMNCGQLPKLSDTEMGVNSTLKVYCVEELRDAGVKFKMGNNNQPFWDFKFDKQHGLLEIPPIKVDYATKTVFLNLIAYEQCHLRQYWEMLITDYVAFMDNLINSASDVAHLYNAGIIIHQLGSDDEVADLFNRLVKKAFVDVKDGRLPGLYKELNRYCNHRRHGWRASWRHDYLKNPWIITSIVAAILLFLLTIVQTAFTILPYSKAPKPN